MRFKTRILILLITSLSIISITGNPKNGNAACGSPEDSLKITNKVYTLTEAQMTTARLIQAENVFLREEVKSFRRSDSLQNKTIRYLFNENVNCNTQLDLKDAQLRKLESAPHQTVVIDSRKWYEIPAAVTVGAAVGILIKTFLIK